MHVSRERLIPAAPDDIWPFVSSPELMESWYHPADRIEDLGSGKIRVHALIGKVETETDMQEVMREHERRIEWDIVGGRSGGVEATRSTKVNKYAVELQPADGGTVVRIESRTEAKSLVWGALTRLIRLFLRAVIGRRMLPALFDRSLQSLAEAVAEA